MLRTLRPQGLHFRRQVPIAGYIVDFACHSRRLIVELDGSQHYEPDHSQADAQRDSHLAAVGYRVHRIHNGEFRTEPNGVTDGVIRLALSLPLSGRGDRPKRGGWGSSCSAFDGEAPP